MGGFKGELEGGVAMWVASDGGGGAGWEGERGMARRGVGEFGAPGPLRREGGEERGMGRGEMVAVWGERVRAGRGEGAACGRGARSGDRARWGGKVTGLEAGVWPGWLRRGRGRTGMRAGWRGTWRGGGCV